MTIYFTGDTHFGHGKIIKYCDRPFRTYFPQKPIPPDYDGDEIDWNMDWKASADKMDETLIQNWNARVQPDDTVYHLGDFVFMGEIQAGKILDRLNGQKILIFGNHDKTIKRSKELREKFISCCDYLEINVSEGGEKQMIVLSHYAMIVWNKSHLNSWMLHGHSHGTLKYPFQMKIMDVGTDCHDYAPVSYEDVKQAMLKHKGE